MERYCSGDTIKKIRKRLKLTQKQFASMLSVHPQTISNWEREAIEPGPVAKTLLKMIYDKEFKNG